MTFETAPFVGRGHDSTSTYVVPWTYFNLNLGDRSFGFLWSSLPFNVRCF